MSDHTSDQEMTAQAALYALGALAREEGRAFEAHLASGCEACGGSLEDFQAVVASLGFGATPEQPPPGLRARLFAELEEEARYGVGESLTVPYGSGEWKEITRGAYVKKLFVDKTRKTVTSLYRLLPGARLPAHRHLGIEECIVLEGDYHINGETLGPGDYHCALPGSTDHTLYTTGGTTFLIVGPERCELLK